METRNKRVLLIGSLLAAYLQSLAALAVEKPVQVINPNLDRYEIDIDAIDTENFEIGVFFGVISIEDFSSNEVTGLRAAYHFTEDFFFEASYGESEGELTSFEKLSGGSRLLSEEDREYRYYNLSAGWNFLPGEVFISGKYTFNSSVYLIGGAGSTEFAGDKWFTVHFGAGFRLLLTDTIAWHLDVRDQIFDRDTFGSDQTTHNMVMHTSFTIFF